MEREANALAKSVLDFLARDFPFEELRQRGYFEFLQFDRPLTRDRVEMSWKAFVYFFRDGDEHTRLHGLRRIVAFVGGATGRGMPTEAAIREAASIVRQPELDEAAIRGWFEGNCSLNS